MRKTSIVFLGGVLAIVASLVVGPAATAKSTGANAGTVVIVHDQEPGGFWTASRSSCRRSR